MNFNTLKNLLNKLIYNDILRFLVKTDIRLLCFFLLNLAMVFIFGVSYMVFLAVVIMNAQYFIR